MHKLYTNPTLKPYIERQRDEESKRLREEETKSQKDGGSILAWKAIP